MSGVKMKNNVKIKNNKGSDKNALELFYRKSGCENERYW